MLPWIVVWFVRLLVPLTILRWPLSGSILAILADNLDVVILDSMGITDFGAYNTVDKLLDTYFYLIQGYTILFWKNKLAKKIGLGLLGFRVVGVIIYELLQQRWLLFVFPNVFIFYYMFYLLYKAIFKKDPFVKMLPTLTILVVLTLLKLGHEYILHVWQPPVYDFFKTYLLTPLLGI